MYNQIFFSFAVDQYLNFKDFCGKEQNPTFAAANQDLLGLRILHSLDIKDLHILSTCLIDYKGYRIIAQAIIPGIISNLDQSTLTEYGSVDEGKNIFKTEEFHTVM